MTKKRNKNPASLDRLESTHHSLVKCDLEFSRIENELVDLLETDELYAFRACILKIEKMTWAQILATSSKAAKRGLNWEVLTDQRTSTGKPIASIRVTGKFRARVSRDGVYMRFISLHPDHDSAYAESGGEDL